MDHILVIWDGKVGNRTCSIVQIGDIVDGTMRASGRKLIGAKTTALWKKQPHACEVINIGNEAELELEAEALADKLALEGIREEPGLTSGKRTRKSTSKCVPQYPPLAKKVPKTTKKVESAGKIAGSIKAVMLQLKQQNAVKNGDVTTADPPKEDPKVASKPDSPELSSTGDGVVSWRLENLDVTEWKSKFEGEVERKNHYKRLYKKYKDKTKDLQGRMDAIALAQQNDQMEIAEGSGIFYPRSEIDQLKMISNSPTILARNMFRKLYTLEQLIGHSLLGQACKAIKGHVPLPPVDAERKDAIIEFTLRNFGYTNEADPAKSDEDNKKSKRSFRQTKAVIVRSVSDYVREINSKKRF